MATYARTWTFNTTSYAGHNTNNGFRVLSLSGGSGRVCEFPLGNLLPNYCSIDKIVVDISVCTTIGGSTPVDPSTLTLGLNYVMVYPPSNEYDEFREYLNSGNGVIKDYDPTDGSWHMQYELSPSNDHADFDASKMIFTTDNYENICRLYSEIWVKGSSTNLWGEILGASITVYYSGVDGLRLYDGDEWVGCTIHYYDGDKWVVCSASYFDGTEFKACTT